LEDFDQLYKKKEEQQKYNEIQMKEEIKRLLIELTEKERKEEREIIRENNIKYGVIGTQKSIGTVYTNEVFQKGELYDDLERKKQQLLKQKENFEKLKKNEQKKKGNIKKEGNEELQRITLEQEEIYKYQINLLKKKESDFEEEALKLDNFKNEHILMAKKLNYLKDSKYNNFQLLNDRYLLLNIIGKGKFLTYN
jgi:tousled-like kinase